MTLLNLTFDVIIVLLGILLYVKKKGGVLVLWVIVAFSIFALSYLLTILGTGSMILLPLRALGYLSVIVGLIMQYRH